MSAIATIRDTSHVEVCPPVRGPDRVRTMQPVRDRLPVARTPAIAPPDFAGREPVRSAGLASSWIRGTTSWYGELLLHDERVAHEPGATSLERKYDGQFKIVFRAIKELMTPCPTHTMVATMLLCAPSLSPKVKSDGDYPAQKEQNGYDFVGHCMGCRCHSQTTSLDESS